MTGMPLPTVFHITHWKAGSQWVRAVLEEAVSDRYVQVAADFSNLRAAQLRLGSVYSPVYLPVRGFHEFVPPTINGPRFVVIRDLRDTLVSWYFNIRHSHGAANATVSATVLPYRERFAKMSVEEGILAALRERMAGIAMIQSSWLSTDALVVRYEEMIDDEQLAFQKIFDHCGFDVESATSRAVVERHSFERRSGRKRGDEDVGAHHRKGIAGDWRNHFTPRIAREFKERFGSILVQTGYEESTEW